LLDFIERTWEFRVSNVALWKFLKQYRLNLAALEEVRQTASREEEEHLTISGTEIVLVDSLGREFDDADNSSSSPRGKRHFRALNARVFLMDSVHFVDCTGPEKTVGERAGEFSGFLETMKTVEWLGRVPHHARPKVAEEHGGRSVAG
jgi:hypothetical protein